MHLWDFDLLEAISWHLLDMMSGDCYHTRYSENKDEDQNANDIRKLGFIKFDSMIITVFIKVPVVSIIGLNVFEWTLHHLA